MCRDRCSYNMISIFLLPAEFSIMISILKNIGKKDKFLIFSAAVLEYECKDVNLFSFLILTPKYPGIMRAFKKNSRHVFDRLENVEMIKKVFTLTFSVEKKEDLDLKMLFANFINLLEDSLEYDSSIKVFS